MPPPINPPQPPFSKGGALNSAQLKISADYLIFWGCPDRLFFAAITG
jgi:hypothetical protein